MDEVQELVGFLGSARADVRAEACKIVVGLSGTEAGVVMLVSAGDGKKSAAELLVRCLGDAPTVALDAANALTNMSANERVRDAIVAHEPLWTQILEHIAALQFLKKGAGIPALTVACVNILNNLTTNIQGSQRFLLGRLGEENRGHDVRVLLLSFLAFPKELSAAALVLTNTSRIDSSLLVRSSANLLSHLMQVLSFRSKVSAETRRAAAETARNCCLHEGSQFKILRSDVCDRMLLALLGPDGVKDQDDYEDLPPLLKDALKEQAREGGQPVVRETDKKTRAAIVDSLVLLCKSRRGRDKLRDLKAYAVIKEYHAQETDEAIVEQIFKLVDLLLGEEDPQGKVEQDVTDSDDEQEKMRGTSAPRPPPAPQVALAKGGNLDCRNSSDDSDNDDTPSVLYQVD